MYEVIEKSGRLDFNRWLPPTLFENWMKVLEETFSYHFENQSDKISWRWGERGFHYQKVFMSILQMASLEPTLLTFGKRKYLTKPNFYVVAAVLTRDNMVKRNWLGNPSCVFCEQLETVDHLFFQCLVERLYAR